MARHVTSAVLGCALALVATLAVAGCERAGTVRPVASQPASAAPSGPPQPGAPGVGDPYFPGYGNGGYDVTHYNLEIRYDPVSDRIDGRAVVTARATQALSRFNLDFGTLPLSRVAVDGQPATSTHDGGRELTVTPAVPVRSGAEFRIELAYGGTPPTTGDKGGIRHTRNGVVIAGEPESAIDWYPSNDHPLDKAAFDFAITVPDGLTAIANGVPGGSTLADGWRTWKWSQRTPMATYLAVLAVGRFRVFESTHNGLPVFSAVDESIPAARADAPIARTPEIVDFLATKFGPYPFEALGGIVTAESLGFALETQTRPIYSLTFFLGEGSSVDDRTSVIAHELAHQWFGDSVSVRHWRDIWINEGFATYAQWLWDEHLGRRTAQQSFDRVYAGGDQVWSPPPGDPGKDRIFAASVYQRGAMAVHALRVAVGDEDFFSILRTFTAERKFGNASVADFVEIAEKVCGKQLDQLIQDWVYGTGRPAPPKPFA